MRILHMDDSKTQRLVVNELLHENHEVYSAHDGDSGIALLTHRNYPVDVVLLDLEMPKKNGLEVLSDIKGNSALSDLPVIMLTDNESEGSKAPKLGAIDYLKKPVNGPFLNAKLYIFKEIKDLERALKHQSYLLDEILEQIDVGIFRFDANDNLIFSNPTARQQFNSDFEGWTLKNLCNYLKAFEMGMEYKGLDSLSHDQEPFINLSNETTGLAHIVFGGIEQIPISYSRKNIQHESGPEGFIISIADISEQHSSDAIINHLHDKVKYLAELLRITISAPTIESLMEQAAIQFRKSYSQTSSQFIPSLW